MKIIHGIGASKGIAIGKPYIYILEAIQIDKDEKDSLPFNEKKRILGKAIDETKVEIKALYERTKNSAEKEAEIFQAHLLFLEDPTIIDKIDNLMKQGSSVVASVSKAFEESAVVMERMENKYFKERAKDIRDVSDRLIRNILDKPKTSLALLPEPSIVVASDLTPSNTASLDRKNVLGFVTEKGGVTSHTAILAEALGIPAVVGVKDALVEIRDEEKLIIDGMEGLVIIEPDEEAKNAYIERKVEFEKHDAELRASAKLSALTKSGKRIEVAANIGSPKDVNKAIEMGADGVGLYRTEFLFLDRNFPPTEEEQFEAYKIVLEKFNGKPVIIRTLDIGGDKQIPYLNLQEELNPFLGMRAIRLCLRNRDLFKTQLRAILRASIYGKALIMYPMIAVKDEIIEANGVLEEVKKELREEGTKFDENIEVGIMVEIPSAALNAESLVDYVDFFSIGTNDLTQYTFAADRANEALSYLYQPLNPALLKLIKMTIDASHAKGKWTGVCGELAGDPKAIPILAGLGIDELSMSPQKISEAKQIIRDL